jgi:diadenosine tetraphosphate (Ap4A) HIT family hydrolase
VLVIPRRHVTSWFDATAEERAEMMALMDRARDIVRGLHLAAGFNIGVNDGLAAGQTVPHLHLHLIPRYPGDVPDPRGGVRWVLPDRAVYWKDP